MFRRKIKCMDTGEIVKGYDAYLMTMHWRQLRIIVAEASGNKCKKCNKVVWRGFHVHHITYKRMGKERLSDLWFMCEDCHILLHKEKKEEKARRKMSRELSTPNVVKVKKRKRKPKIKPDPVESSSFQKILGKNISYRKHAENT